jgi:16S rRNA (cytosine967-C5)-methyltransferase
MTPGARVSSALELLNYAFTINEQPFDIVVNQYFKQRRYAGSQDRRTILEIVYGVLRNFYKLFYVTQEKLPHESAVRLYLIAYLKLHLHKEEAELNQLFSGDGYAPLPLTVFEQDFIKGLVEKTGGYPDWSEANVPEFLWPEFQSLFGAAALCEAQGLSQEATVDLRINLLKENRESVKKTLENEGIEIIETPYSPFGIRLQKRVNLKSQPLYQQGLLEIQDEASQLVTLLCEVQGAETILDYCAGAGGKTLTLSMLMRNQGRIDAYDVSLDRLKKAELRAERAGSKNIFFLPHEPNKIYDRVLVDAPCSGIGTWRRHPEWRLTLTPQKLSHLIQLQKVIISKAAKNVKKGGRLIYVTCSVLACENEDIVNDFLIHHPQFKIVPVPTVWERLLKIPCQTTSSFFHFTPYQHKTDGFFIAILEHQ